MNKASRFISGNDVTRSCCTHSQDSSDEDIYDIYDQIENNVKDVPIGDHLFPI